MKLRNSFSARAFLTISLLVLIGTLFFTVFFFFYQRDILTNKIINKGEILADILAYNAKLGVFTQNGDLLTSPISGVLNDRDVKSVDVFTVDGKCISSENKARAVIAPDAGQWDPNVVHELTNINPFICYKKDGNFNCWSRVSLDSVISEEEKAYFNVDKGNRSQLIGFVKVTMDGKPLRQSLIRLLYSSILIGFVLLVVGSIFAYFLSTKVTKPIAELAAHVRAFGENKYVEIPVVSDDEIGCLAEDINLMVNAIKKRESEAQELQDKLQHSSKMESLGTLAGGVAHDFNNILMAINGYASLLQQELVGQAELSNMAEQIQKAGEHAASLTRQLVAFSRKQDISPKTIHIDDSLRQLELMLSRLIPGNIYLHLCLNTSYAAIMMDPGQFGQILINLVTNASDAMPQGGTLRISSTIVSLTEDYSKLYGINKGSYALITVSDTGVGIPFEIKHRIFDPFFTTKDVGKGTGLGLSLVYGIVKQNLGIIEVDSEINRGTTFSIYLPLSVPVQLNSHSSETPVSLRGNQEMVLIAEDDPVVMGFLVKLLESNNYNVISAINGEEAIELYIKYKHSVRILLLDVVMPEKNGKEVFITINALDPSVKAIFISGYTNDVFNTDEFGKNVFITKPVRSYEILSKLRSLLSS